MTRAIAALNWVISKQPATWNSPQRHKGNRGKKIEDACLGEPTSTSICSAAIFLWLFLCGLCVFVVHSSDYVGNGQPPQIRLRSIDDSLNF